MTKKKKKERIGPRMLEEFRELVETFESGGMEAVRQNYRTSRAKLALKPSAYTPEKVRETRDLIGLSQTRFAVFLGVSPKTVQAWEQGVNSPSQGMRRLLDEMRHDPKYWIKRVKELTAV